MRAALVIVGDEILSAKTEDLNTPFLTQELRALGVEIARVLMVSDSVSEIAWATRAAREVADFVLTTGGIGPTHDDVTIEGVAEALGRNVVVHPALAEGIRGYLAAKGAPATEIESALKMAQVPEGAELVAGTGSSFPIVMVDDVYLFPGIPSVLREKWAAIKDRFRHQPVLLVEVFLTPYEHQVAPVLYRIRERFPQLGLGSYPVLSSSDFRVKVTLESRDSAYLENAKQELLSQLDPSHVFQVRP